MTVVPKCKLEFPTSFSGTGVSETMTFTIQPCSLDCGCYVKQDKHWCNHCVDVYGILQEIIYHNPNLTIGQYMGISMKQLRGKCTGELCNRILNLLLRKRT